MSEPTKYYKTVIQVTVISEGQYTNENLEGINDDITDGPCSGAVETVSQVELTAKEAADALMEQGSDPEFFQLDEDGNPLDADEEE